MELRILGPVGAWQDGTEIDLAGAKQRTVLAALLLADGRIVSDERLSRRLWGWDPPATSTAQIHTYVSRLRQRLGPELRLVRQSPGYLLHIQGTSFDLAEFERLARDGHRELAAGRYEPAGQRLRAALDVWRGPALGAVTEFLADIEVPRLEEARLAALESRIEVDLALGAHHRLVPELTHLVAEHPVRERFRAQLMSALYRCDRQSDALAVYHEGRRVLAEELGVDPGPALARAHQTVLVGERSAWHRSVPAMLPPDIPDFVGRRAELAELSSTLVTVTGMAGVGKTALALRVARAQRDEFPDGQLWADLGGGEQHPKDPYHVLGTFLGALCAGAEPVPAGFEERLRLYRSRTAGLRLLVLLDNSAGDAQVRPLLPSGAGCRTIITSRARLTTLPGARVVNLGPLEPAEALALLAEIIGVERVVAEPAAAATIIRSCAGLALAVRIAGARLAADPRLPLTGFATRLTERTLAELSPPGGVRESLEHSYRGLSPDAQAAFRDLGRGVVDGRWLEPLADARLVDVAGTDSTGRLRYQVHHLVYLLAGELASIEDNGWPRCPGANHPVTCCAACAGSRTCSVAGPASPVAPA